MPAKLLLDSLGGKIKDHCLVRRGPFRMSNGDLFGHIRAPHAHECILVPHAAHDLGETAWLGENLGNNLIRFSNHRPTAPTDAGGADNAG